MLFHTRLSSAEAPLYRRMAGVKRSEAVSMFGWLKSFVSSLVGDARLQKFEETDCRLATAALLTRVATVNSEMSEAR